MKKTILNLGAILMAFIIGVTINNACASKIDNMSDSELRNLVSQLQKEVNSLKERVAELEDKIGGSSGRNTGSTTVGGGFEVNGVHFDRAGNPDSPYDYIESYKESYAVINGERQDNYMTRTDTKYNYDSYGRISFTEIVYPTYTTVASSKTLYSYSDKTLTTNTVIKYNVSENNGGMSEYGYSTTYHYK
jgi:hypothetical protein